MKNSLHRMMRSIQESLLVSKWLVIILVCIVLLVIIAIVFSGHRNKSSQSACSVSGINMHGQMYTYDPSPEDPSDATPVSDDDSTIAVSEDIVAAIESAEYDPDIKAVMLDIDSYGGSPVAGEEVAHALRRLSKPSVAYIRSGGVSAAYWAATGANYIFASRNSDIGSIGVTASYIDNTEQNKKEGLKYIELTTGEFKDAGTPDRPLTERDRSLFDRDLRIILQNFIDDIARNRSLEIADVAAIADGSTVLGDRAKELGLIDDIGGYFEAVQYIENIIGEPAHICWK